MGHLYARSPGGRQEHLTADRKTTLCGKDCKMMAKYSAADNKVDSKVRPICPGCNNKFEASRTENFKNGQGA